MTCAVCDRQKRTSRRRPSHSSCVHPTAIVLRSPRNWTATSVESALTVPGRSVVRTRYGCSGPRCSIGGCRSRVDAAVTEATPLTRPPAATELGVDGVGIDDEAVEGAWSRCGVGGATGRPNAAPGCWCTATSGGCVIGGGGADHVTVRGGRSGPWSVSAHESGTPLTVCNAPAKTDEGATDGDAFSVWLSVETAASAAASKVTTHAWASSATTAVDAPGAGRSSSACGR